MRNDSLCILKGESDANTQVITCKVEVYKTGQ